MSADQRPRRELLRPRSSAGDCPGQPRAGGCKWRRWEIGAAVVRIRPRTVVWAHGHDAGMVRPPSCSAVPRTRPGRSDRRAIMAKKLELGIERLEARVAPGMG